MKKVILSVFALMLVIGVSAQNTPEQTAEQSVGLENRRAGGNLSEAQQKAIYDAYLKAFKKETSIGDALKVVRATLTPEQMAARTEYLEKTRAKQAK